jgi:hypothetical protein
MAEIPAHENFKNTKTSETNFLNLFGTKRKVVGNGRFSLVADFLPEVRSQKMVLSATFRGSKLAVFQAVIARQKRLKLWPSKRRLENYFRTSGRKSVRLNRPFTTTSASQSRPCFSRALRSARSPFAMG